jgi:hypothetical protein
MNDHGPYLTEFGILEFTTEELLQLSESELRFLITASLITNDVRFHWSLMVRSKLDGCSDEVKVMQLVRDFWTLRKLSSVIYEADKALNGFIKKIKFLENLLKAEKFIVPSGPLDSGEKLKDGYMKLAGQLRNSSSYHYGVGDLIKNIKGFDTRAKHIYFAHPQQGNSISALCEQIITLPTINAAFEGANMDDFHKWCRDSSNSILRFCNLAIAEIVTTKMPEKFIQMKQIVMGAEAAPIEHRWPLCLVVEKQPNK